MKNTNQVNIYGQASNGETVEYRIEREAQAEDVDVCAVEPVAHFVSRFVAVCRSLNSYEACALIVSGN